SPVRIYVELAREGGAGVAAASTGRRGKRQTEKIARQRVALDVNRVAPRIAGLEESTRRTISEQSRQRVVVRGSIAGAVRNIGELRIVSSGAHRHVAIHDVRGDEPASVGTKSVHFRCKA